MRPSRAVTAVELDRGAWQSIVEIASDSAGLETGGILLGYRVGDDVRVVVAEEIKDASATESSYNLKRDAAQERLDEVRRHLPEASQVGFVGDWHTHPKAAPPSRTDWSSLARLGRHYRERIVSVVVVRQDEGWNPYGLTVRRWRIRACAVRIVDEKLAT